VKDFKSSRRKFAIANQFTAKKNHQRRVHVQDLHGHSANGCSTPDPFLNEPEMIRPMVIPGVEEANRLTDRFAIESCDIRPLVAIAMQAGKSQVSQTIASSVLARHNMLTLKRNQTAASGSRQYSHRKPARDRIRATQEARIMAHWAAFNSRLARAWRIESVRSASR
jgi:hypothetical protein